jgi:alkylation response protein AidB-like acyl-CoA dehydrogenase
MNEHSARGTIALRCRAMSTVHHYRSNLRDVFFNLFEFLDVGQRVLGREPYASLDEETARETLKQFERVCSQDLAAAFAASDRDPPKLGPDGAAILPESLKRAMESYYDGGWHLFEIPTHLGGVGAPPSLVWASFEMVVGSCPAAAFYLFGSFMGRVIDRLGTPSQRARYLPQMIEKRWGAAMVLTEPDAGSDVGAGRTRARHVDGDVWEIEGTKRFITNGDYDSVENVVHLLLARPEGGAVGTKGLSLFIVPKYWVNEDGSLGERNGWRCSKLEKKMGLRASVTCEIVYGGDVPARGLLVGEVHDGIRQMFHVIEQARMAVGMKSLSTLSTGYLNALAYTKDRVQGPDLARAAEKDSPRVPIIAHADVRRMLMLQKSHAEGMRALALWVASLQDEIEQQGGHGHAKGLDRLNDLLLPLIKGFNSERAFELLSVSLQCYGGAGYVEDFPAEQYLRDQKIDSLYEGTTHIQSLDLFFRKVARDGGATLGGLFERVRGTLESAEGGEALAGERALLATALDDLQAIYMGMLAKVGESVHHVGLQGNRVLMATAETVIGWLLVRHAAVALAKRGAATGDDAAYYDGKVASARFFCREVLPNVTHARTFVERSAMDLMDLPVDVF